MGQNDEYIKLAASIPGLKEKINVDIDKPSEKVYWYIKFNTPLDEQSVSKTTMGVTDKEGYILDTEITYSQKKQMIVINPLEAYVQNEYYFLNISKKVRSEKLQELKNDIHILFKLKGNVISEFKILPPDAKVPTPRRRIVQEKPIHTRVYAFEKEHKTIQKQPKKGKDTVDESGVTKEYLKLTADFPINPTLAAIGMVSSIISIFVGYAPVIVACALIALAGFVHVVFQISRPNFRSIYYYNKGARLFNKERYFKARFYLDKALGLNPENEYAEYAMNKLSYYL